MLDFSQPVGLPIVLVSIGVIIVFVIIGLGLVEFYKKKANLSKEDSLKP